MARRGLTLSRYFGLAVITLLLIAGLAGCGGGSGTVTVSITKPTVSSVDPGDAITLMATVAHDSTGVNWTLSGSGCTGSSCGALSGSTATSVTYMAPTTVGTAFSVTITATSKKDTTKSFTITLSIPANPGITTAAGALAAGQVGSPCSVTLAIAGGISPYTWSVSQGGLPAGIALASSTGVLSGTPTASGSSAFTLQVRDSGSPALTASGQFTISISPAPAIVFSTTSLPNGTYNASYTATVAATGGAGTLSYAVTTGSLPAGLSMTSAGAISGKLTAGGTSSFTVTASDPYGDSATQNLSITVTYPAIVITPASGALAGGTYKVAYSQTLTATGGSGSHYSWSVTSGTASLGALNLTVSSGGSIGGTPQAVGTATFSVQVQDSAGNTQTADYTIAVTYPTLTVTTASLPSGTVNTLYSQTLAATGGSGSGYAWSVTSGQSSLTGLNLTLTSAGLLSGTPATSGSASFTVQVKDSASNTATANLSVTINASLAITTTTLPAATTGAMYSQQLTATGGSGGNTWSTTGANNLSTFNLTLSSAGLLSGTPASTGAVNFTAQVKDSSGDTATEPLSLAVYNTLGQNAASLPLTGTTGVLYTGSISAGGGSGNYSWTVTGLSDNLSQSVSGGMLTISGTPDSAATVSLTVKLTDTATPASVSANYSIVISNPTPLSLPSSNPGSLGSATVNQLYSGAVNASGGVGPYTWKINGAAVTGGGVSLGNNLTASNTGGNTLTVSGTPSAMGSVSLTNVTVTDSETTPVTAGPGTYTIQVNSAGSQVSGQIMLNSNCGGNNSNQPIFTVTINTSPQQQTTTDSNGNYSFASVPNGNYTITPSLSGASSVFFPASHSITVNNNALSGVNFGASVGFTVSGTVNYSGSKTGRIYLNLVNGNCSGGGNGTSLANLSSGGSFTIQGVAPGTYTLSAMMDILGEGAPNESDPGGSSTVTVTTADESNIGVALQDPGSGTPTAAPNIRTVTPGDQSVVISYKGGSIVDNNGEEIFTSYTVQWSTSSSFTTTAGSATFKAVGTNANVWILTPGLSSFTGSLANGAAYYFRARGSTAAANGPWSAFGSPTAVTIGAPTTGNTVTGTVTIPAGITPMGPLYVGYYDESANAAYVEKIVSPSTSNIFTVNVPTGSYYFFFGILDQNNDGLIDAGDVTNTNSNGNTSLLTINSNLSGQDLTLPAANSTALVTTQYQRSIYSAGSYNNYQIHMSLGAGNKLPVAVQLTGGPNAIQPVDMTNYCQGCGSVQYQYNANLSGMSPSVGDTYTFAVSYSDGSSENVTGAVTAVLGSGQLAVNLSPTGTTSSSTTPAFSWNYPANASNYVFQFQLWDSNGNTLWQVPSQNGNSSGFAITQIPSGTLIWGVDPTDSSNTPSVGSLTSGQQYSWQIQTQDSHGNSAAVTVNYQP